MSNVMKSYVERNEGKPMRKYKITKRGAKHTRAEGGSEERAAIVVYGAPDPGNQFSIVSEIVLTDDDAKKLQTVLGLVPILDGSSKNVPVAATVERDEDAVRIPADWAELSSDTRKELASKLTGEEVKSVKKADAIISEHLRGAGNTDSE